MPKLLLIWILVITACPPLAAQQKGRSFHDIDWNARFINATTPESLSYQLTSPYTSEFEKVRSIFSWITQNISYNTGITRPRPQLPIDFIETDFPDSIAWKSANEMTAYQVLKRRVAVCEGYAKLFTTLCQYAGIKSEVVTGFAICCSGRVKFRTNHSWNAVRIDSAWYLLDLTWASGYVNQWNEFVQRTDENYFLAAPERFIRDHFPDDLRWALLDNIPFVSEFKRSPYMNKAFVKYKIGLLSHPKGLIEAGIGDTIRIELQVTNREKDKKISPDPFFDSTILSSTPRAVFVDPEFAGTKAIYTFVVPSPYVEWLHLSYNEDIILRYRLDIKKGWVAAVDR